MDADTPLVQPYWVVLSQDPLSIQATLVFVQPVSLVHPLSPLQVQVADPPQLPGTKDTHEPLLQAEYIALLQDPLIGVGGGGVYAISHFHWTTSILHIMRSTITERSNQAYHAVIRRILMGVATHRADIWRLPFGSMVISLAVTPV